MSVEQSYTLFRKSKPFGYYPPEVEKTIEAYNRVIDRKNMEIETLKKEIEDLLGQKNQLNIDNEQLKSKVKELVFNLDMMEVPSMSSIQENYLLNELHDYGENKKKNHKNLHKRKEVDQPENNLDFEDLVESEDFDSSESDDVIIIE